jgi:hypothetical protein
LFRNGPSTYHELPVNSGASRTECDLVTIRQFSMTKSASAKKTGQLPTVYYIGTEHPFVDVIETFLDNAPRLVEHGHAYVRHRILSQLSGVYQDVAASTIDDYFDVDPDEQSVGIKGTNDTVTTREQCLEALQTVAEDVGESPTIEEYRSRVEDDEDLPGISRILNHFETWNDAKEAAGLERTGVTYTVAELLDHLTRARQTVDQDSEEFRPKHYRGYRIDRMGQDGVDNVPTLETMMNRFGSWEKAVSVASMDEPGEPN